MRPENIEDIYELSPMQQGLLFHALYSRDPSEYLVQLSWTMEGEIEPDLFDRALDELVRRHAVLRTSFHWEELDRLLQVVHREAPVAVERHDWSALSGAEQEGRLEALLEADRRRRFDLAAAPLMRVIRVELGNRLTRYVWTFHHLILDGWSMSLVLGELFALLEAHHRGAAARLPAPRPYRDFILWLRGLDRAAAERFWRSALSGFREPVRLPARRPTRAVLPEGQEPFAVERREMAPDLSSKLGAVTRRGRVTLNTLVQGVWSILLGRWSGRDDVLFGAAVAGRPPELEGAESMVGLFINTLPVRIRLEPDAPVLRWLQKLQESQAAVRQWEHTPLVDVHGWSEIPRSTPLFESILVFENYPTARSLSAAAGPWRVHDVRFSAHTSYPLHVRVKPGESLRIDFVYDRRQLEPAEVRILADQFESLLARIAERPEGDLRSLSLATASTRPLLPDPEAPIAERELEPITETFARWASVAPARPALRWKGRELDYGELHAAAVSLARWLRAQGLERGEVVAVSGPSSFELITGMLGVLLAGGVLLVLDPHLPEERRRRMLDLAGARRVLAVGAEAAFAGGSEVPVPVTRLDRGDLSPLPGEAKAAPREALPRLRGDDPAYVFFTSGTAGVPKPVLGLHKGLGHFVSWQRETFEIQPDERFSQLTGLSFDVVLREIFVPLTSGALLCLPDLDGDLGADRVLPWLAGEGVSVIHTVPTLAESWLAAAPAGLALDSLRLVFFAGEPLLGSTVTRWRALCPGTRQAINLYGPTETTLAKCFYRVPEPAPDGVLPVGAPLPETQALILGEGDRLCGVGECGEIVIRTPYRTRGYLGQTEETEKRFRPNPYRTDAADLLYFTGDRGRYRADGNVEILGRTDHQVKIRGARVELGEIESLLAAHPQVRRSVVVYRKPERGEGKLVAYAVPEPGERPAAAELREHLRKQAPDYMVPSAIVLLETLPVTPNGKIDRAALPEPEGREAETASFVGPRTPIEEALAGMWRELLGVETPGVHDDFFERGGHSLLATQLVSRVRKTFRIELPLRTLFDRPTLAALASAIEAALGAGSGRGGEEPIAPVPRGQHFPLSFAQQRLWFLARMDPASPAYNIFAALRLRGDLSFSALRASFAALVQRHETLRTRFPEKEGRPVQIIDPEAAVPLAMVDLTGLPEAAREPAVQAVAAEELKRPFDLASGPLLRATLMKLSEDEHGLLIVMHHIISDGWSRGVFTRELTALYDGFRSGRPASLPALPIQYADFAQWQRAWLRGEVLERQLAYWKERLAGLEPLALPADRPRAKAQSFRGAARGVELPRDLYEELRGFCRREGVTPFMLLLSALQVLFHRYTGQEDVAVGSPIANRRRGEAEHLIGFFVNALVMRGDLSGNPRVRELLARTREAALGAYAHQDLPFEKLVEELQPERHLSRNPLFQVMLALQNAPRSALSLSGLRVEPLPIALSISRFDLELHLFEGEETLRGVLLYSTDLFDADTVDRLLTHYRTVLRGMIERPEALVSELPLLDEEERRRLTFAWNATDRDYPRGQTVHRMLEAVAARRPDATAVSFADRSLTYRELDRRASQLAHYLRRLGVRTESRVGVCLERSLDLVVCLLGILKAGGAYVALDPDYPDERLAYLVADSAVELVLTERALASRLERVARPVLLEAECEAIAREPAEPPASGATGENLAYVAYTSGSTGAPKGVEIPHRGILRLLWNADYARLGPEVAVLQLAPVSFDASTFEIWGPLLHGGRLVVFPDRVPSPRRLGEEIERHRVTALWLTASLFNAVIDESPESLRGVREILTGGEALSVEHVRRAAELLPDTRLVNGYGPTESTTFTCCYPIPREIGAAASVPIGRPIPNTRVYILDARGNQVPVGGWGELYVGGDGLARGYARQPALTAERFVPDPVSGLEGARLYRTGDRVRYLPDGRIEFLGRLDDQVKIRGFRIEPGEIEAALDQHPAVRESVVIAREAPRGGKRLVAYVAPRFPRAGEETGDEGSGRAERVERWQKTYDEVIYSELGGEGFASDPSFNIAGWNSSYTGLPIEREAMREQVEQTVSRILSERPSRVLEIGCGTGLLLFRLAPLCRSYWGTDFSSVALDYVREHLEILGEKARSVELLERTAEDFSGIEPGRFDAVVLNSVVQYFPSAEYLRRVIEGAVAALADGGSIFIGDVRHLPLLRAFYTAVELHRAPDGAERRALEQKVLQQVTQEQELVLDPAFFTALKERFPRIRHVAIQPKRGRHRNELTQFRYDVIVRVGGNPAVSAEPSWIDWRGRGLDRDELRRMLSEEAPEILGITGVPNARTEAAVAAARLLFAGDGPADAAGVRRSAAAAAQGIDPEDLWQLEEIAPYRVDVSWANSGEEGAYDVLFRRRDALRASELPCFPEKRLSGRPESFQATNPLQGTFARGLVPELRAHLASRLPEYMVPSAFLLLDAIPLTPNGKVDRAALPEPVDLRDPTEGLFVAPRSRAEKELARIWREVLGLERVGVDENFFELGGDSILSILVVSRAGEAGLAITPKQLFENQTIAALARVAEQTTGGAAAPEPVEGPLPLGPIQRWFFEQDLAEPHHFNQSLLLAVSADVEPDSLERAVSALLEHHDALRSRFPGEGAAIQPRIAETPGERFFHRFDLSRLGAGEAFDAQRRIIDRLHRSLSLAAGPLFRAAWFSLPGELGGRLFLLAHHLVVDGVSWRILLDDLETACAQLERGGPVRLPRKTSSFKSWTEALERHADSGELLEQARFWTERLEAAGGAGIPLDGESSAAEVGSAARLRVAFDPEATRALLQSVPKSRGLSIQDVLLGALLWSVTEWRGGSRLLVDIEGHGREPLFEGIDLSRTVGWFTSLYPVLLDRSDARDPEKAAEAVRDTLASLPDKGIGYGALRHLCPRPEIRERLRSLPRAELSFNYLGQFGRPSGGGRPGRFDFAPESAGENRSPRQKRSYRIEIQGRIAGDRLTVDWLYSRPAYRQETIEHLAERFRETVLGIVSRSSPWAETSLESGGPAEGAGIDELEIAEALGQVEFE